MDAVRWLPRLVRRHPVGTEIAIPAVLAILFIAVPLAFPVDLPPSPEGRPPLNLVLTRPDVALTVASALVLLVRRRLPLLALVGTGALTAVALVGHRNVNLSQLALAIAMFNFALRRPRGRTILAAVLFAGGSVVVVLLGPAEWGHQDVVFSLCTAAAIGIAVQSRRAAMAALEDRARRAEETREETARRRVAEDRVRIARELHDVIAHHVAVISVQAGVAAHVAEGDPGAARDALATVRSSAKEVLDELQSVLGVLRQDENLLPTTPAPGLSRLPDLLDSLAATGSAIRLEAPDPLPRLPPAADLAAYRLLQEALTNVHKHATGASATVRVREQDGSLVLGVTNGPPPRRSAPAADVPDAGAPAGFGLGLVGMRERVTAAGGKLRTGPTDDGGFEVAAQIPLPEEDP